MATQTRPLAGRVVAITGGARGIGRATAAALVRRGARVALGDLDLALAQTTAAELGSGTIALPLDVTDRASFTRFLDEVEAEIGPLDVLINNAGIMHVGPFLYESDAAAERMLDINVRGVILGSKLALERFVPRRAGHLVNIASTAGKAGIPGGATYSASKFAVVGLTEALRGELRGSGVETSVVMPVVVNTELAAGLTGSRSLPIIEPDDVAAAIVDALEHPRHDVFVPKSIAAVTRLAALLPRRATEAVGRAMKTDQILTKVDTGKRRGYEERAAESEPERAGGAHPVG